MNIPFEISAAGKNTYRIRNRTDGPIQHVTVKSDHPAPMSNDLPVDTTFGPGETKTFTLRATLQTGRPVEVHVSWDVHPTPHALPLPPY